MIFFCLRGVAQVVETSDPPTTSFMNVTVCSLFISQLLYQISFKTVAILRGGGCFQITKNYVISRAVGNEIVMVFKRNFLLFKLIAFIDSLETKKYFAKIVWDMFGHWKPPTFL